jgi:hypothetical protein
VTLRQQQEVVRVWLDEANFSSFHLQQIDDESPCLALLVRTTSRQKIGGVAPEVDLRRELVDGAPL